MLITERTTVIINFKDIQKLIKESNYFFPKEVCGLISLETINKFKIRLYFHQTENSSKISGKFLISKSAIKKLRMEFWGCYKPICGVFHSHPFGKAVPSYSDKMNAIKTEYKIWAIYSVRFKQFRIFLMSKNIQSLAFEIEL